MRKHLYLIRRHLRKLAYSILKRRLVCATFAYIAGMLCVRNDAYTFLIFFTVTLFLFLITSIMRIKNRHIVECAVYMIVFFCIGTAIMAYSKKDIWNVNTGDNLSFEGSITEREESEYSLMYTVDAGDIYHKILVYCDPDNYLPIGSEVLVEGNVEFFERPVNDGQFDVKSYYKSKNIDFKIVDGNIEIIKETRFSLKEILKSFREFLGQKILSYCRNNGGILKGILTGDKSDIPEYEKDLYQKGGISHILAISGLHVSNIAMIIGFILSFTGVSKKLSIITSSIILIVYSIFSGFSSSVFRATCMFVFSSLAYMKGSANDICTSMSVSYLLYSFMFPQSAFSSGTIMSYMAVLSIYVFAKYYKKVHVLKAPTRLRNVLKEKLYKPFALGLFLSFFTFPVVVYNFYSYPLFSVLINMYVITMMPFLFVCGLIACILLSFFPLGASLLFKVCDYTISSFTSLTDFFTEDISSVIVTGRPEIYEILIYYLVLLIVLVFFTYVKKKYFFMLLMIIPFVMILHRPTSSELTMLDVDQGECIHISDKNGGHILVDCGSLGEQNIYKNVVEPYLLSNGIKQLEYVFLSHADNDHINGILQYLENPFNLVEIKNIVITYPMLTDTEFYNSLISSALNNGINIKVIKAGENIMFGDSVITCIYPDGNNSSQDKNADSMVLLLNCNENRILMTGDLTKEAENKLDVSDVDILKVAHHGSKTGTSSEFLAKISPEIALISCGKNNDYGHPSKEVLDNLKEYKIKYYITSEKGQIRYSLND